MSALVELVAYIRTLTEGEYVDGNGHVWLIWKDRAVRLAAYYR